MTGPEAKRLRKRLKLSQTAFWLRVGITQSGGSRYEKGRALPKPIRLLLAIAYGTKRESDRSVRALRYSAPKRKRVRSGAVLPRWVCSGVSG